MGVELPPLRVAVADDSAESRALLRAMLDTVDGVDVVGAAADGAQAVDLVARQHPDLILLDIAMPVMDGLEAAAVIRASDPDTKIAMYSAYNRARMRPAALAAGADEYVEKAATAGELLAQIQRLFPDRPVLAARAPGRARPSAGGAPVHTAGEQRYRLLLDALEEGVLTTDSAGLVTDANFVATRILDTPVRRLLGRPLRDVGLDGASSRAVVEAMRTQRPVSGIEFTLTRPDGERRDLLVSVRPLHDPASLQVRENIVSFIDLTEQKTSERRLAAADARMRRSFDAMLDCLVILSAVRADDSTITDFRYQEVNAAACRLTEMSADQLIGHLLCEVLPAHRSNGLFEDYVRVVETGQPLQKHATAYSDVFGSGRRLTLALDIQAVATGDELLVSFRDVTDGARARDALVESERRYRRIVETAQEGILSLDADFTFTFVNARFAQMLGCSAEELIGTTGWDVVAEESVADVRAGRGRRRAGESDVYEVKFRRKDGSTFWTLMAASPVTDADGRHAGSLVMVTDIDDRKRAGQALAASERRLRDTVDALGEGLMVIAPVRDERGRITDFRIDEVNEAGCRLAGATRADLVGRLLGEARPWLRTSGLMDTYIRAVDTGESFVFSAVPVQGQWLPGSRETRVFDIRGVVSDHHLVLAWEDVTEQAQVEAERRDMEERLRASEELFRKGVGSLLDGFAIISPVRDDAGQIVDFRWEYANDASCRRNGLIREQMIGHRIGEVLPGYPASDVFALHRRVAQTGEPARVDEVLWEGEWTPGQQVAKAYDGTVVPLGDNLIVTGRDITDAKRAQADLARLTELLSRTEEIARTGGWEHDLATGDQFWSDQVYRIYGIDKTDGPPSTAAAISAAFEPECLPVVEAAWRGAVEQGRPYDIEAGLVRGDGERVWVRTVGRPVLEDGRVTRIVGTVTDITDHKATRDALAHSEQRYRRMLETAEEGVWTIDTDYNTLFVNARLAQMLGYSAQELVGTSVWDHIAEESAADARAGLARRRAGLSDTYEAQLRRKDGSTLWVLASLSPVTDPDGRPTEFLALITDMTDRKRAEQELAASEQRLHDTLNALIEGVSVLSPVRDDAGRVVDFRYEDINEAGCRLGGLTRDQCLGRPLSQVRRAHRGSGLLDAYAQAMETGQSFEMARVPFTIDGEPGRSETRFFDISGIASGGMLVLTWRDVTAQAAAETQRREAEERLQSAISSMTDGFLLTRACHDEDGTLTDLEYVLVNDAGCRLTGRTPQELLGHTLFEVWHMPEARPMNDGFLRVVETEVPYTVVTDTVVTDTVVTDTDPTVPATSLRVSATKVGDGCLLILTDLSERVEHERQLAAAHAEAQSRAEKLERSNRDLEAFASALSHDLREPLRTTAGFVQLITDQYAPDLPAPARELFGYVVSGTDRMNDRITAILNFARSGASAAPPHPVDSAAAAATAARDSDAVLTETGAQLHIGPLPVVSADALQLQRVFQNLLTNAAKYHRPSAVPHITISADHLDDHWQFTVADNGPGVPDNQRERIFGMFTRGGSDETHDGHGMGPAICRRIIESYDGHLWVDPNPDGGSLFRFTVPTGNSSNPDPAQAY